MQDVRDKLWEVQSLEFQTCSYREEDSSCVQSNSGRESTASSKRYWSSQSFYIHLEGKSAVCIRRSFKPYKRGSKFKHLQKTLEEKLREELDKLKGYLEERDRQIHWLINRQELQKKDPKPVRCPNCGCEKVYRNVTYEIRPKGFFDNLKTRKE